ncbi:hypothetical protein HY947_04070 [Candidatus Gottesmanbacteria bacterium]|nr:hypothetical protein [Candidatus Gottesmanbacteria bacterium]
MKKLLIVAVVFIFVLLAFVFFITKEKQVSPENINSFYDIHPGKTTKETVEKNLGEPISTRPIEDGSISNYKSENAYWTNDVYYKKDMVRLTKTKTLPPQNTSLSKRVVTIGEQPTTLYGPESHIGIYLYVYPKTGIAYLANKKQDIIYEEWKFSGVDISSFLQFPEVIDFSLKNTSGKPD